MPQYLSKISVNLSDVELLNFLTFCDLMMIALCEFLFGYSFFL